MSAVPLESSAPGKLILMGEHSAVYRRQALVAAIDLRTRVSVEPIDTEGLVLELPDLELCERCSWTEVVEFGDRRREQWRRWNQARGSDAAIPFPGLGSGAESGLAKVAIAEALACLEREQGPKRHPGLRVSVASEVPRGAGFGSSASVAVALGAALLASLSGAAPSSALELESVAEVALEVEKRQHGSPSGVDHTAVVRGGFLSLARDGEGLGIRDLPAPEWLRQSIRVFDTGTPAESTGEVVDAVRKLRAREPRRFTRTLDDMDQATSAFRDALHQSEPAWPAITAAIRSFESCLEQLGVVPAPIAGAIRMIEAAGGAAKISGAGSLSGVSAGCLLVFRPRGLSDSEFETVLAPYRAIEARLGAPGVEVRGGIHA